jgi:hypothetical protein
MDYSKGYSQDVKVQVTPEEVASLMDVGVEELKSASLTLVPLHRDGKEGDNRTNGDFGGWFNADGNPYDWGQGHVYIEVFDDLFSWDCGLRADDGHCEKGHSHTVTMQYKYKKGTLTRAVNVDVNFTIE